MAHVEIKPGTRQFKEYQQSLNYRWVNSTVQNIEVLRPGDAGALIVDVPVGAEMDDVYRMREVLHRLPWENRIILAGQNGDEASWGTNRHSLFLKRAVLNFPNNNGQSKETMPVVITQTPYGNTFLIDWVNNIKLLMPEVQQSTMPGLLVILQHPLKMSEQRFGDFDRYGFTIIPSVEKPNPFLHLLPDYLKPVFKKEPNLAAMATRFNWKNKGTPLQFIEMCVQVFSATENLHLDEQKIVKFLLFTSLYDKPILTWSKKIDVLLEHLFPKTIFETSRYLQTLQQIGFVVGVDNQPGAFRLNPAIQRVASLALERNPRLKAKYETIHFEL